MAKIRQAMVIVFDLDTETNAVETVKSVVMDEEKVDNFLSKKTINATNTKKSKLETVEGNKGVSITAAALVLTEEVISTLDLEPGVSRVLIQYEKVGSSFKPIIKRGTGSDGNRLTLNGKVAYRGKSNDELSKYGNNFSLVPSKLQDTWYLVDENGPTLEEAPSFINPDSSDIGIDLTDLIPSDVTVKTIDYTPNDINID